MGKYHQTVGDVLNRDHAWANQEIITEAVVLFWLALQIALKFGTRFFPEWQNTRLDPDYQTGLDKLLARLGHPVDGCMWDGIVSAWKPSRADTVTGNQSTLIPAADERRGRLGYVAVFVTVCATVLLSVSVGCSLLVNRNWRYPPGTQHVRWCKRSSIGTSLLQIPTLLRAAVTWVYMVVAFSSAFVCSLVWLVLWVLPVFLVAGAAAAVAMKIFGQDAVFPCCVLLVSTLSIHCTGRIWGLWMKDAYFTWIKNRRMCGAALLKDSVAMSLLAAETRSPFAVAKGITAKRIDKETLFPILRHLIEIKLHDMLV
ncbi:uncharacterized protein LOC129596290 [Paramacrobiotus metropolitanus]|uniref:uncharacterized protein LOC129596290 n=1 Tax=Paramacrobiotus metropolitanus TaxID=2943436 RepID=UPI00244635C0|nr:uncharacterized protein LOC129596290 [Paramacrobiotus metropolitanus]